MNSDLIKQLRKKGQLLQAVRLGAALSMSASYEHHSYVVHGDNERYWIVTVQAADRLQKAGYEVIGAFGKLYDSPRSKGSND